MCDIVQCFKMIFDKEIIQKTDKETNRYAAQYKNARGNLHSCRSLLKSWTPVTGSEMYTVLGLFLLMGIVQNQQSSNTFRRKLISTPGFGYVISRERFVFVSFSFYRQWQLTNISRTSNIFQNVSCNMSFKRKLSNFVPTKPKRCHV
jgi:hypothetical protein